MARLESVDLEVARIVEGLIDDLMADATKPLGERIDDLLADTVHMRQPPAPFAGHDQSTYE